MVTFCIQAIRSGNYYCGHEPSNHSANCWSDREHALVMTIQQAREFLAAWPGGVNIVIAVVETPAMSPYDFDHELFCVRGGTWYYYRHRERLNKQKNCSHRMRGRVCKFCGARNHEDGYWYDPITGATIDEELKV